MDSEAAPTIETTEVSRPDAQEDSAGQPGDAAADSAPKAAAKSGKKSKRQFRTLEDAYNPIAYTQPVKGTGGKGKKGKGEDDGRKGKGKGAYYQEGGEAPAKQGPADDVAQSPASNAGPGPVAVDGGDPSQQKGGSKDKKRPPNGNGGKNNRAEGAKGGKGSSGPGGGGGGGQQGPGAGGGKAQQPPRKGSGQGGKGPRGPLGSPDIMMDGLGPEVEGPRTPGPQQRPPAPAAVKGGLPGGMVGMQAMQMPMGAYMQMPMGFHGQMPMGPMGYGGPMPAQYMMPFGAQGMPGMPVMYAQMPQGGPFMAAPAQVAQAAPALTPGEHATMVRKVKEQVEYYFGVDNLLKDVFLRKHMTDEGWLPISLIASFSRVSQMTRDPSIVMEAVSTSQIIETDAQRQNIRLRNDWPRWILAPQQAGAAGAAPAATTEPAIRSTP